MGHRSLVTLPLLSLARLRTQLLEARRHLQMNGCGEEPMDIDRLSYGHPYLLCYRCLRPLQKEPGTPLRRGEGGTIECPTCEQALSPQALHVFTLCRRGIESDFNEWLIVDLSKGRIATLGAPPAVPSEWQVYLDFVLAAVAGGVIGNAAYDLLKRVVERLFKERFPKARAPVVEYHVQVVFHFLQAKGCLARDDQGKEWAMEGLAQVAESSTAHSVSDSEMQAAIGELSQAFRQLLKGLE